MSNLGLPVGDQGHLSNSMGEAAYPYFGKINENTHEIKNILV